MTGTRFNSNAGISDARRLLELLLLSIPRGSVRKIDLRVYVECGRFPSSTPEQHIIHDNLTSHVPRVVRIHLLKCYHQSVHRMS